MTVLSDLIVSSYTWLFGVIPEVRFSLPKGATWYPLVQLDDFADGTMDTRVREYDVLCDSITSSYTYHFSVIPEVRNELSGIHLYNETILILHNGYPHARV